jgi:hypothetical protein
VDGGGDRLREHAAVSGRSRAAWYALAYVAGLLVLLGAAYLYLSGTA